MDSRRQSWENGVAWAVAFCIALGILPSFTALSETLADLVPQIFRYTGPLNPLKFAPPLLLGFVWLKRRETSTAALRLFATAGALGSLFTLIAGARCGFPPELLREWAAIVTGVLASVAFTILPRRQMIWVLIAWVAFVYFAIFLDLTARDAIDWLYLHVFDPNTGQFDKYATDYGFLTGVWGNQSLAKILSWMPWLVLAFGARLLPDKREYRAAWFILAILSTALILKTSQRGPLLGAIFAWTSFAAHRLIRYRDRVTASLAGIAIGLSVLIAIAIVPRDMLEARVKSMFGYTPPHLIDPRLKELRSANENILIRRQMLKLTINAIMRNPLGNACIPYDNFREYEIYPMHSHHLFLQQYRDRGWIWGTTHLALWVLALACAWRLSMPGSSAFVAGIVAIFVQGQLDHPWFVLNHAMILGLFLYAPIALWFSGNGRSMAHARPANQNKVIASQLT